MCKNRIKSNSTLWYDYILLYDMIIYIDKKVSAKEHTHAHTLSLSLALALALFWATEIMWTVRMEPMLQQFHRESPRYGLKSKGFKPRSLNCSRNHKLAFQARSFCNFRPPKDHALRASSTALAETVESADAFFKQTFPLKLTKTVGFFFFLSKFLFCFAWECGFCLVPKKMSEMKRTCLFAEETEAIEVWRKMKKTNRLLWSEIVVQELNWGLSTRKNFLRFLVLLFPLFSQQSNMTLNVKWK